MDLEALDQNHFPKFSSQLYFKKQLGVSKVQHFHFVIILQKLVEIAIAIQNKANEFGPRQGKIILNRKMVVLQFPFLGDEKLLLLDVKAGVDFQAKGAQLLQQILPPPLVQKIVKVNNTTLGRHLLAHILKLPALLCYVDFPKFFLFVQIYQNAFRLF